MTAASAWLLAAGLLLGASGFAASNPAQAADAPDPDVARLVAALAALESDPALADSRRAKLWRICKRRARATAAMR